MLWQVSKFPSFLKLNNIPVYVYNVNNAAMNMAVLMYLHVLALKCLEYMLKSEIAELYVKSMFNFLRFCHTIFHSSSTILHFHQQYHKGSKSSTA